MGDFDKKYNIVDEATPPNTLMSAHYKRSFAYYTLRDRLPVILTQVLDNLSKDKDDLVDEYSEDVREELKDILGNISKLKYELQTDKEMTDIETNEPDRLLWKIFLSSLQPENKSYFTTCWLYAECYMYRRLRSFFEKSEKLQNFDYFLKQKQNALTCCTEALEAVVRSVTINKEGEDNFERYFRRLLKLNLWGNRCDLSISEGKEIKQIGDLFSAIDSLNEYILIDQTKDIWDCVAACPEDGIIDFINDNAGYEVFTDFLIAAFLIEHTNAKKIRFFVKAIPWFISDVTPHDFRWTLEYLSNHESEILRDIGQKWSQFVKDGKFELCPVEYFWTGPYEFFRMPEIQNDLYMKLSEAHLGIFKGDLNYRKLLGDYSWSFTERFETCLRGFRPTNICALRTVKADLICGLEPGVAESLTEKDPSWMTTGQYGVIQFASKV